MSEVKANAEATRMSLSYSFPYAGSTIYLHSCQRWWPTRSQAQIRSSSQQPAMLLLRGSGMGLGLYLSPSSPSQGQGLVSICSAANVAWHGMHFDSCPWRLQGLLRIPPRAPLRSAARCTDTYPRVPDGQGQGFPTSTHH